MGMQSTKVLRKEYIGFLPYTHKCMHADTYIMQDKAGEDRLGFKNGSGTFERHKLSSVISYKCQCHAIAVLMLLLQSDKACYGYKVTADLSAWHDACTYSITITSHFFIHSLDISFYIPSIVAHPMMLQCIAGLRQNNSIYPWTEEIWAFSGALHD